MAFYSGAFPESVPALITSVAHHDSGVRRITLALLGPFQYRPGQYLNIVHGSGVLIPLSIASSPERLPQLELHFRPSPDVPEAALMNELLAAYADGSGSHLEIEGPHGNVVVEGPTKTELLLIAGGTGIAQCCGIIEHLAAVGQKRSVWLLWSVTHAAQLYCDEQLRGTPAWLDYMALIDMPGAGNAASVYLRQRRSHIGGRIILSGSTGFVYAVDNVLREIGVPDATVESDVFSYAPRQ